MLDIKIKLLHPDAVVPYKATEGAFGYDVKATNIISNHAPFQMLPGKVMYGLGFALEIPLGEGAFFLPRSSINKQYMLLANSPGLGDPDYRGELKACFYYFSEELIYKPGERVAQLVFLPDPEVRFIVVDELTKTVRGEGGFGHTGR